MKKFQQFSESEEVGQGSNMGSLPIIRTEDEISSDRPEPLPINQEYLSTHFQLISEDCFSPFRCAIQGFRNNLVPRCKLKCGCPWFSSLRRAIQDFAKTLGHRCKLRCGSHGGTCKVKVVKDLPCGHQARLLCCEDAASFLCDKPCDMVPISGCGHICRGTCGSCKQGTANILCKEGCSRELPCGHQCMAGCSEVCPPCKHRCKKRCVHSDCILRCGTLCVPCIEKCEWKCEHHTCDLPCHEPCTRPRCDEPCQETLRCGHPCIGLCGEPCPKICRTCNPKYLDVIKQMTLEECDPSDKFVQLLDCLHVFEVSGLDNWMDMDDAVAEPGATAVKLKQCPACRSPIRRTLRYSNIVKRKLQQIEEFKKLVIVFEKVKRGGDMLKKSGYNEALVEFSAALRSSPGLLEAHLGQACALCGLQCHDQAIEHLSFIIEHSSYKVLLLEKLPTIRLKYSFSNNNVNSELADNELAIYALLQWALVCSTRNDFASGLAICDIILQKNPDHAKTAEIRVGLENRVKLEVIEVVTKAAGGRGHWYQCRNGHYYVVGGCGEPLETSQCPDCRGTVGGDPLRPAEGNRRVDIDRISHRARVNNTVLGAPA